MGVLTQGSAHAWPSAQPPYNTVKVVLVQVENLETIQPVVAEKFNITKIEVVFL